MRMLAILLVISPGFAYGVPSELDVSMFHAEYWSSWENLDNIIIHYDIEPAPFGSHQDVLNKAVDKAISMWENANPEIKFAQNDNPYLVFAWWNDMQMVHVESIYYRQGIAECHNIRELQTFYHDGVNFNKCVISAAIGSNTTYWNQHQMANLLAHEIGHVLGVSHETSGLMYSIYAESNPMIQPAWAIPDKTTEYNSIKIMHHIDLMLDELRVEQAALELNLQHVPDFLKPINPSWYNFSENNDKINKLKQYRNDYARLLKYVP